MQYEDIVFPAAILRMCAKMESWLKNQVAYDHEKNKIKGAFNRVRHIQGYEEAVVSSGIDKRLFCRRNDIAHGENVRIGPEDFERIRKACKTFEDLLPRDAKSPGMTEVMVSASLPYDMGNAGDLIKHGALAEFVRHWLGKPENQGRPFRYADTFAGRPWGLPKKAAINRLTRLKNASGDFALVAAQRVEEQIEAETQAKAAKPPVPSAWRYFGSSAVVRNLAAQAHPRRCEIKVWDKDRWAQNDLWFAGFDVFGPNTEVGKSKDGCSILKQPGGFDLILIDPFYEFMKDQFFRREESERGGVFARALAQAKEHSQLTVAVFALFKENQSDEVTKEYEDFLRRDDLRGCPRIRCQPIRPQGGKVLDGEDGFCSEIVFISAKPLDGLEGKLRAFAEALNGVLGEGTVEVFPKRKA